MRKSKSDIAMNKTDELVESALADQPAADLPPQIRRVVDSHRQNLIDLANSLIAAGRSEEEVVRILEQASESFSLALQARLRETKS